MIQEKMDLLEGTVDSKPQAANSSRLVKQDQILNTINTIYANKDITNR